MGPGLLGNHLLKIPSRLSTGHPARGHPLTSFEESVDEAIQFDMVHASHVTDRIEVRQ